MQPTEIQVRELWEWCGLVNVQYDGAFFKGWQGFWGDELVHIPSLDSDRALGFLFKWAMPKLDAWFLSSNPQTHATVLLTRDGTANRVYDKDPALALFWAIYKVIKGE